MSNTPMMDVIVAYTAIDLLKINAAKRPLDH
jgi:hypothetical protein